MHLPKNLQEHNNSDEISNSNNNIAIEDKKPITVARSPNKQVITLSKLSKLAD